MPIKVYILSNDDLTSNVIFAPVFNVADVEVKGVALATSPARGSSSEIAGTLALRRRMAGAYWWYLVLTNGLFRVFEWLTLALNLSPRFGALVSLRALARDARVRVCTCRNFNAADFADHLASLDLDLLLIRIGTVLDERLLQIAARGTWCVHSSLLPALGGIAGEFHALRLQDMPIGSTVFEVAVELDRGPPLAQAKIARESKNSVFKHMMANNVAAGHLLGDMLRSRHGATLHNAGLRPSYFSWPTQTQLTQLRATGHALIDFSECVALCAAALRVRRMRLP